MPLLRSKKREEPCGSWGLREEGQRAKGKGQRAKGKGQRAKGKGQRAKGKGQRAKGKGQRAKNGRLFGRPVSSRSVCLLPFAFCLLSFASCPLAYRFRIRGSIASRRPSPKRLIASTVSMIARPGKKATHH